ncbi:MAG: chorismate synthase [Candidatus Gracilibacteria bacterium]|nr:chorismate synthase [Candidatus Gracilibacteria bacterium]
MNTFGHLFRITTFGESHGGAVGVVLDGCPAGLKLEVKDFFQDLARRRTGQSSITSARQEIDEVEILSGVFEGKTIGSPILLMVRNKDARSNDYKRIKDTYRPSHADYTYDAKYGVRNWTGGGRASARETTARVMAGVVAKKILKKVCGMNVLAYVDRVGLIGGSIDPMKVTLKKVEANIVRCPDAKLAKEMIERIKEVQKEGDTIGGTVSCIVKKVPVGLGDPVFAKIKASLAQAMMSLPATMGVEFGSGFGSLGMIGSEHNDVFESVLGEIKTKTNFSGGIQGGITNGMPVVFRTVFKPVSTIFKTQETVTKKGKKTKLLMPGRHDPCVVPRAVVMVEAMTALVMVDALLRQKSVQI